MQTHTVRLCTNKISYVSYHDNSTHSNNHVKIYLIYWHEYYPLNIHYHDELPTYTHVFFVPKARYAHIDRYTQMIIVRE